MTNLTFPQTDIWWGRLVLHSAPAFSSLCYHHQQCLCRTDSGCLYAWEDQTAPVCTHTGPSLSIPTSYSGLLDKAESNGAHSH